MGREGIVQNNRIHWLDAWKGFATLLVVTGHIADGYLDAGLFAENTATLQKIYEVIYSFHMPLFFVLSGYAFYVAYARKREERAGKFRLQLGNIAIVYVIFSVIQWIFKMLFAGQVNSSYTVKDLLLLPVKTMDPYWYLYVLFLLYVIGWLIEKEKHPEWLKLVFFLGLYFLSKSVSGSIFFEIKRTLYYSLFFYFGIFLAKSVAPVISRRMQSFLLLYQKVPRADMLSKIGTYSLEIYVLHCFITAANRIILIRIGITEFYFNIFINLVMATGLPMLGAFILKKLKLHAWFFKPLTALTKHTSVKQ